MKKILLLLALCIGVLAKAQTPVSFFTATFENSDEGFVFSNGTQANQWVVGQATANNSESSLYITNNQGTSNAYTFTSSSTVHAYKDIAIPAGTNTITVSFDWKSMGEEQWDYMRVWLAPATYTPMPGVQVTSANSAQQIAGNFAANPEWTTHTATINILPFAGTTRRLIFEWRNDFAAGINPPAAVDNINISHVCATPTNLIATNITQTTATLGWTDPGAATAWEVEVVAAGTAPTGMGVAVTANPYIITGLTDGCYEYYVRSICNENSQSIWAGPYMFCMSCAPENQCNYQFLLSDSFGDGWGGNTMSVLQNNTVVATLALSAGTESTISVPLCDGLPFELYWNTGGSFSSEIGISVVNSFGQLLYQKPAGQGQQGSSLFTGTVNCQGESECLPPPTFTANTYNSVVTLSWSGGADNTFEYLIAGSPFNPGDTPGTQITGNTVVVDNLEDGLYYGFVRRVCTSDINISYSDWNGPAAFVIDHNYSITGYVRFDANANGICNEDDFAVPNTEIHITGNGVNASVYTDLNGRYNYRFPEAGTYTVSFVPVLPNGFAAPVQVTETYTFTASETNFNAPDFCIQMAGEPFENLSVDIVGAVQLRPGNLTTYTVKVKNTGNVVTAAQTVTFNYNTSRFTLLSGNTIINIGALAPLWEEYHTITLQAHAPPVNNSGDVTTTTAHINYTDDLVADNTTVLTQIFVNSFDPNDIIVHEGAQITPEQADGYLTYTVRFQNTGTAPAARVIIEQELDENLDWNTFIPVSASHNGNGARNGNALTYMFNNINLPHSDADEPSSHGYITYRVKPKATIAVGDIILGSAAIYFDFNEPVITNTCSTEVVEETSGTDSFAHQNIRLYPNPVNDRLNIDVNDGTLQSVQVYDLNGRLCLTSGSANAVDTHPLSPGLYLVKVATDKGTGNYKLIKR
ncbi:T9SS type A sorting domain-containing protein [Flavobacterium sp. RHBU_24]|uniref:DUF7619 domain-containing protein n=1 Tax=Flavobacterium sp. RHBU_24 TaxID=3391185 RepID=UPI003984B74E